MLSNAGSAVAQRLMDGQAALGDKAVCGHKKFLRHCQCATTICVVVGHEGEGGSQASCVDCVMKAMANFNAGRRR